MKITKNEGRYLKMIYRKQREENEKLSTCSIAKNLNVRPPSVTEVLQRLAEKEFLKHDPYNGVELTERGIEMAREQLRKHRVLEILLAEYLGYSPEKACEEAIRLDYCTSEDLINSICRSFDHPEACPCGKEIFSNQSCVREGEGD